MSGYVDTKNQWLVIDTASRKGAENALTQVREALGSFPAVPLAPEEGPRVLMTSWLNLGPPAGFALGDECELRDPATDHWRDRQVLPAGSGQRRSRRTPSQRQAGVQAGSGVR